MLIVRHLEFVRIFSRSSFLDIRRITVKQRIRPVLLFDHLDCVGFQHDHPAKPFVDRVETVDRVPPCRRQFVHTAAMPRFSQRREAFAQPLPRLPDSHEKRDSAGHRIVSASCDAFRDLEFVLTAWNRLNDPLEPRE